MNRGKKRRKQNVNEVQVFFPRTLVLCLAITAIIGMGYMTLNTRCNALGKAIKAQEADLLDARKRLVMEQDRWAIQTSPVNLKRALRKHGLAMAMPESYQVVRIKNWEPDEQTAPLAKTRRFSQIRPGG